MITCPACNHQNIDGTQFCEMCGEELSVASTPSASSAGDVKCPNCGHLNPPENLACEACGTNLKPASAPVPSPIPIASPATETTPFDSFVPSSSSAPDVPLVPAPLVPAPVVPASAPVVPGVDVAQSPGDLKPGLVKLVVEQGQTVGAQFVLGDEQMEVGREDEDEAIYPDIDLSDQDAGYVHRRHATIGFDNGHLFVTHLGGANKTRLNNKPVADNVPAEVKVGDKIAFGKVVLRLLPV